MDSKEQLTPEELEEFSRLIESIGKSASPDEFSQPDFQSVNDILGERKGQRRVIFWFSIGSAGLSFLGLFAIIGIQAWVRIKCDPNFSLLSGYELEVLSVAVFGQILGIIYIIAKSIWDDSIFKDFYKRK